MSQPYLFIFFQSQNSQLTSEIWCSWWFAAFKYRTGLSHFGIFRVLNSWFACDIFVNYKQKYDRLLFAFINENKNLFLKNLIKMMRIIWEQNSFGQTANPRVRFIDINNSPDFRKVPAPDGGCNVPWTGHASSPPLVNWLHKRIRLSSV